MSSLKSGAFSSGDKAQIRFMNIRIDNLTYPEAIANACEMIDDGGKHFIVTPNVDHIVRLESDEELTEIYKNADMVLCDGKPLIWISKLYGNPIKEKISGSDFLPGLCEIASERGYTMFLFGAGPGVAKLAGENLSRKYHGLKIAGWYSPPYGFESDPEELSEAIRAINEADPDILVVALGCPKQEKFIYRYRDQIKAKLSLGLGASLDFEAGVVKRAPVVMQKCGLEWLFRITQDPKRLARRYLIDDMKIIPLIFKYKD